LRRDVITHWGTKSIHEIKKRDVIDLVAVVSQRNEHAAYRLLSKRCSDGTFYWQW
jgi:hypothetical protein